MNNQAQHILLARGAGLFPLYALTQCDGFFADWRGTVSARQGRITRDIPVQVPAAEVERLRGMLAAEGWELR